MKKVKICGLRRKEDILIVNRLKPDYVGFVFADSSRKVTKEEAKALSKQLEKESLYQDHQVYNEMVKNMYEGLTLSVTVTYGDGTTEIVDVGFKEVGGGDNSGKVSDKVAVYVK